MDTPISRRDLHFARNSDVEVVIAPNGGACFGVVRAIKLAEQAIQRRRETGEKIHSFGPVIHNTKVVNEFTEQGLEIVQSTNEVKEGTVLVRSHGVMKHDEKELRDRNIEILDATCPLVKKPQKIAKGLGERGYFLILVGDPKHPEVKGVVSYFGREDYLVTYSPNDLEKIPQAVSKVGILAQTTIENTVFESVIAAARKRFAEVIHFNTICDATSIRQSEVEILSKEADVMVVIGGKNSSNTNKLVKISKQNQQNTYHIETIEELRPEWFQKKTKIGITGGASTPEDYVDLAGTRVAQLMMDANAP